LRLYFTDKREAESNCGFDFYKSQSVIEILKTQRIAEGTPFLLSDDGTYDERLNGFLRDLPCNGCPSSETWKSYAKTILAAQNFFERLMARHLLDATFDDYRSFKAHCFLERKKKWTARSWNQTLAALEKLVQYSLREKLIEQSPFHYRQQKQSPYPHQTSVNGINTLYESYTAEEEVRFITLDDYLIFRDVGLLGLTAVGAKTRDPEFTGRNPVRNAAIAEFLLVSGLRVTEGTSFLTSELPTIQNGSRNKLEMIKLAPAIAKRGKSRKIMLSHRMLRGFIGPYLKDRADIVLRANERSTFRRGFETVVAKPRGQFEPIHGGSVLSASKMSPDERRRYVTQARKGEADPLALFLSHTGRPITPDIVRKAFKATCLRLERIYNKPFDITPHTLRHTFAVAMLTHLIRILVNRGELAMSMFKDNVSDNLLRSLTFDPLNQLRLMLGHSSIETTYGYLTFVQEAIDLRAEALSAWEDELHCAEMPRFDDEAEDVQ